MKILIMVLLILNSGPVFASQESKQPVSDGTQELKLLRRWAVFPFYSPSQLRTASENAWWNVREKITNTKKYLVASKSFLSEKDVFYPRKKLSPDDVRLLSNLLDADVLVTGQSDGREFTLNVYLAQSGQLFWTRELSFHPSLKAGDQLELVADKMIREILALMPYQGFTIVDPLIASAVYDEGNQKFAIVDVGQSEEFTEGMDVQWLDIRYKPDGTLKHAQALVIAEGKVAKVRKGVIVAEILRVNDLASIKQGTPVRFPKQAMALAQAYVKDSDKGAQIESQGLSPVGLENEGKKKNTVVFGGALSFLGLLLLAL